MSEIEQAKAKLAELERALDSARQDLKSWEEYDSRREDGSGAQDRRHEESGQYRREQLEEAAEAVSQQKKLIASLT